MATLTETLTEALGLDAGADEDKILSAVTGVLTERDNLKTKAEQADESLEDRAKAEGKVVIENDQLQDLTSRISQAEQALADRDFDSAFDAALSDQRVDAKEDTRKRFRKLFDQDRDTTLELLANSPKLVKSDAAGKGGSDEVADAPDGVDADSHALNREVQARLAEHSDETYTEALDKVLAAKQEELV